MTIDEAIAHAREVAYENIKESMDIFPSLNSENCLKCAEEHEQIAEWLELLKWYEQGMKDIPSESGVLPKDVYHAGYNKAIDDAKSIILQTLDNEILVDTLHLRLEQLKAGTGNGTDNQ